MGYSLNDTIIVYDRIRENMSVHTKHNLVDVLNRSVNETLSRTLLTSLTVLLSMIILFAFNVGQRNSLEGFSFAMIVGVITGTYSSVYVASPFVLWLGKMADKKKSAKPPGVSPDRTADAA